LKRLELNFIDIVISDGYSNDGSIENILKNFSNSIHAIILNKGRRGLSIQLLNAFNYAINSGYEFVITMDGNNKDDPNGINIIYQSLIQGFDFVQGSRFLHENENSNTPNHRKWAIKLIHAPLTSFSSGFKYTDTTNGFRGFSLKLLLSEKLDIFREDVFVTYELLSYISVKAPKIGMKCIEVPVIRKYPHGKIPTKITGVSSHFKILNILFKTIIGVYDKK
jgi:glycosyltransferase involved in cell wall biosynthesis